MLKRLPTYTKFTHVFPEVNFLKNQLQTLFLDTQQPRELMFKEPLEPSKENKLAYKKVAPNLIEQIIPFQRVSNSTREASSRSRASDQSFAQHFLFPSRENVTSEISYVSPHWNSNITTTFGLVLPFLQTYSRESLQTCHNNLSKQKNINLTGWWRFHFCTQLFYFCWNCKTS